MFNTFSRITVVSERSIYMNFICATIIGLTGSEKVMIFVLFPGDSTTVRNIVWQWNLCRDQIEKKRIKTSAGKLEILSSGKVSRKYFQELFEKTLDQCFFLSCYNTFFNVKCVTIYRENIKTPSSPRKKVNWERKKLVFS